MLVVKRQQAVIMIWQLFLRYNVSLYTILTIKKSIHIEKLNQNQVKRI